MIFALFCGNCLQGGLGLRGFEIPKERSSSFGWFVDCSIWILVLERKPPV
jgi:hypothetical protein